MYTSLTTPDKVPATSCARENSGGSIVQGVGAVGGRLRSLTKRSVLGGAHGAKPGKPFAGPTCC